MKKLIALICVAFMAAGIYAGAQEKAGQFKEKVMYVDFRTQVHTMDALKELAQKVAADGFTCMMLEYEATFPFEKHATLQNKYAFTKEEIKEYVA